MAKDALTLILLFTGVFILLMILIAGISANSADRNTNLTDTQDTNAVHEAQVAEQQKPFIMGLTGLQMLLLVVLILGGISIFIGSIVRQKRQNRY